MKQDRSSPAGAPGAAAGPIKPLPVQVEAGAVEPAVELSNYTQALKFLNDRYDVERMRPTRVGDHVFKLDRISALLGELGKPHEGVKTVHVAGSKGKGSVCEMLAACLHGCGYTVGLFTSPHLVDVRERMRINGKVIPHADFTRLMESIRQALARLNGSLAEPTFFEVVTALAFAWFAHEAVDIAVIEVGLGGRLDCTNVIVPEVSAIASISKEHTQILGDTLDKIAREKAGIFKPGVPAITVPQEQEALDALRDVAQQVGAPLYVLGRDIEFSHRFQAADKMGPHMRVNLSTERVNYEHLPVPLPGEHQAFNCGLALAVLDRLVERGFSAPEPSVLRGLASTERAGRLEVVCTSPRVLVDGAHTPESIRATIRAVGAHVTYDSLVVIFGCAGDKDVEGMLRELALGADKVIFTRSSNPRACQPADLHKRFSDMSGKMCQTTENLVEAMSTAGRAVQRDDLILVTGSFYLAGEAKKHVLNLAAKRGKEP